MSDPKDLDRDVLRRFVQWISDKREPFEISGVEAHLLLDGLELLFAEWAEHTVPVESVEDAESDAETKAHIHDLSQRLWEFCGFPRRPR